MNKPETILKQIAQQHGITILAQSRLKGLILDMMPTAEKKYINVMRRAIDEQIGSKLLEMQHDDPAVRQIKVNTLKEKFKNDNAFDDTAFYIVDCFIHTLGWNNSEPEIILPFKEIKIGKQIWADRNLDVSHFRNGDPIPEIRDIHAWENAGKNEQPASCYYQSNLKKGKIYGKLYNWYAVNDPRGLGPEGWHVSSFEEWEELIELHGGYKVAGNNLKATRGWFGNRNGANKFGFSALPGGKRLTNGLFDGVGNNCKWWTVKDPLFSYKAICLSMSVYDGRVQSFDFENKSKGLYVRCIKDSELLLREIQIGNIIWAGRNLNVSCFCNGDPIPEVRGNEEWNQAAKNKKPAWCYFDNNPEFGKKFGKLYNWYAVNDPRGLAPEGWKIPTDDEWAILEGTVDSKYEVDNQEWTRWLSRGHDAGKMLKSKRGWHSGADGTDNFGFSALPGGARYVNGNFHGIGYHGEWWSAKEFNANDAWFRSIEHNDNRIRKNHHSKDMGLSVRCVRNID